MNRHFSIKSGIVHLWQLFLPDFFDSCADLKRLLSEDEIKRTERFHFPIDKQRFTVTRAYLRQTLSLYTGVSPSHILFTYGPRQKPYLRNNPAHLQFNVSHSHEMAVIAITGVHEIGIDIEKIENIFKDPVAKRFFTDQEYRQLLQLPKEKQSIYFYRLWSRKEALIKALGEGLYVPLEQFTTDFEKNNEIISLQYDSRDYLFEVQQVAIHSEYQCAFATKPPVKEIEYWQWTQSHFEKKHAPLSS